MNRIATLFAVASIALLLLGIALTFAAGNRWITIWRYGFSLQTPCYGVAALFCIFAFLESIAYIPFGRATVQWHFWLSVGSAILFIAGFVWLGNAGQRPGIQPNLGFSGTVMAISFISSIPIFLAAQAWFAVGLVRALLRMGRS